MYEYEYERNTVVCTLLLVPSTVRVVEVNGVRCTVCTANQPNQPNQQSMLVKRAYGIPPRALLVEEP